VKTGGVARWGLRAATAAVLVFLYLPIAVIGLYAFNGNRAQTWPITKFTTEWFQAAVDNQGVRDAFWLSLTVGLEAMLVALVLGTLAALALHRFQFFGRDVFSFALILPIALPGIVTAIALNSSIRVLGLSFGTLTIILGHATFCIVIVYNNVIARLRRSSHSIEEASADLGADPWQTFRHVTFPVIRTALLAGGLLAFALSFDEIIVTQFTAGTQETIPIWILNHLRQPNQRSIVNVVALFLILLSTIPVYVANRLASDSAGGAQGRL
jgi:putative spermidine/putrescine transport system permease protein